MKRKLLCTAVLFSFIFQVQSQQTGSFNTSVMFNGQSRTLSCYVPNDYDSTLAYKVMIGLHGMGDNSTNYRNVLSDSAWRSVFPQTIFVFPDGGGSDFFAEPGSEDIILEAFDFATSNYHIDSSYVVLQGFSLGGRSALKFGLDHPEMFKGLLLNTPAVQGANDGRNDSLAGLHYDYSNADQIPVYMIVGEDDVLYDYTLKNTTVPGMRKNDAILDFYSLEGVDHILPSWGSWMRKTPYDFFDDPASAPYDMHLFDAGVPYRTCSSELPVSCFFQNTGDSTVTSVEIHYSSSAGSGSLTWSGEIGLYEHAELEIPDLSVDENTDNIQFEIGAVNGSENDTLVYNNELTSEIQVEFEGVKLPFEEDFEKDFPGWIPVEKGNLFFWYEDTDESKSGNASMATFNTILLFYTKDNVETLESPLMDLSDVSAPTLNFDVAFNYHLYTPPYFVEDTAFADTLEINISTDCGQTYQNLYKKGGADLATAEDPITNPLDLQQVFFSPAEDEWREETIDLSDYEGEENVIIRFDYKSDLGGSIYIDDVLVDGTTTGVAENEASVFKLYPNPAKEYVTVYDEQFAGKTIQITDLSGKVVKQAESLRNPRTRIDISGLKPGMYMVSVNGKTGTRIEKLSVQ